MSENIRSTNLRFNLDKDVQNRAWQYLQTMDKKKFKSYSQIIAISLVDYFDRYYQKQDDPYLETREREERFVAQIVTAVEKAMDRTLPVYLAGCMAGIAQITPQASVVAIEPEPEDADLDWDFLGE
ncbi:MAG: adenylate cyclase [Clostridia bacterium]|nr:adenylate cyclase [Clostridia bacterium]